MEIKPKNPLIIILNVIRYFIGVFICLMGIFSIETDGFFSIFTFLFGISFMPFVYKKLRKKRVLIQIVAPIITCILFGCFLPDSNAEEVNTSDVVQEENVVVEETEEPEQEVVEQSNDIEASLDSEDGIEYLKIGESAIVDDLQITVKSYVFSDYAGNLNGLNKVENGLKYCVVYISAKNLGTSSLDLFDGVLIRNSKYVDWLYFDTDYKYNSTWSTYTDFFYGHDSIPALGEINCCLCYKVSKDVQNQPDKPLVLEFGLNQNNAEEYVYWKLR